MAASTRFFSLAAIATVASSAMTIAATPAVLEMASRASGRINNEQAYRGSERLNPMLAYRGSGRFDSNGGYGLLAYRGSGRFNPGLTLAYRASERGIHNV